MIFKNKANQGVYLFAYDKTNDVPKTGDAANITGKYSLDGSAEAALTIAVEEIGGGVYWQGFTAGQTNGDSFAYTWESSTDGITIDPVIGTTDAGKTDEIQDNVALRTVVNTVITADTEFTVIDGSTEDDAYNNMIVTVVDASSGDAISRKISDYTGSTKQITVDDDLEFAIDAGDTVIIWADTYAVTAGTAAADEIANAVRDKSLDSTINGTIGDLIKKASSKRY